MGTGDRQREFEQIVAGLTADYPSLAGRRRWSRTTRAAVAVVGGVVWALLSVAMVAWGTAGVLLTLAVVALAVTAAAVDARRRRRW
ncbi:putative membrane protein [Actinoplanes campanulatus]|uniref:Putative membrane protein n=1 Tax=Actinoplanes campanulatus TaxID=113559 RepID=A0A7W5FH50_9ACTN|nr:hypothetical protein [Actinoplanes campanulatus]MBB3098125.1 putative membrane protein [Actinoplanes campanulatus]GGN32527.1 hypothetical protein GCM10010109_53620 [Actinoplanes campanulatus]GID40003.1 hypothetical protein Aca09nite_65090 [Actinoplanes campanulatus]